MKYPGRLCTPKLTWQAAILERVRLRLRDWLGVPEALSQEAVTKAILDGCEVTVLPRLRELHAATDARLIAIESNQAILRAHLSASEDARATCEVGQDALSQKQAELQSLIESSIQNLQSQITALSQMDGPLAGKPKQTEGAMQIMPGMTRFSDRKRNWIAEHRKSLTTEAGKQIEENSRLIASGTRAEK